MTNPIEEAVAAERARSLGFTPKPRQRMRELLEEVRGHMAQGLACRMGGPVPDDALDALRFVGAPFQELLSTLLQLRGVRCDSRSEMLSRAISTGDVSALLTGAGNRVLRKAYESYSSGLLSLCGRVESRDFRDVKAIQVDGDVALQEVKEGVIPAGWVKASADTYTPSTFGRTLAISQAALLEDDLASFSNLASQLGRAAAEFVAGKIAALLETNPTLSDGVAVFHAGHSNLGTGGVLSETTLGELLKLLRAAKGLGGEAVAAVPKALVVPSALEVAARKLVTSLGNPAPYEIVVEPRLASATAFYVFSDPAVLPAITYTYPGGNDGPTIDVGNRFNFQGLAAKVLLDFGCGFADPRGVVKNVGA
jgi:hypothetical protein